MEIKIYGELREQCPDIDVQCENINQALAAIKHHHGQSVSASLLENKYHYLLASKDDPENLVPLTESLLTMPFNNFDAMVVVPDIEGELYAVVILGIALFTTTSAAIAIAVAAIINIAIALALGFIMQLLSPTPEFDSDPSEAQLKKSSLFNGPQNNNEQGGSVPICFGKSIGGGVRISGGLYAEDV